MKNLWLIPTDKPSRLSILNSGKLNFGAEIMSSSNSKPQHIYITNNEKPKVGDWGYCKSRNKICKVTGISKWTHKDDYSIDLDNENYFIHHSYCKKIILTTDQDLIKDGVQAIDAEFLEWFVKNPSCEKVEIEKEHDDTVPYLKMKYVKPYKIIIPKEELKQETWEELTAFGGGKEVFGKFMDSIISAKQETLEEAAKKYINDDLDLYESLVDGHISYNIGIDLLNKLFIAGAKYEAERMYSEEEVKQLINQYKEYFSIYRNIQILNVEFEEWFEQFSKLKSFRYEKQI